MFGFKQRALIALARFVCRRAALIVLVWLVLLAGSVAVTVARIEFITDRNALMDPDTPFNRRFLDFGAAFGDQEPMLLMLAPAPGPEGNAGFDPGTVSDATRIEMKRAAAEICAELRSRPDLFPHVLERVDPAEFAGTGMLYLPHEDLAAIRDQLAASGPLLHELAREPSYAALLRGLRASIEQSQGNASDMDRGAQEMAGLLGRLRTVLESPRGAPGMEQLFEFRSSDPSLDPDGYFFAWQGRLLFVPVMPTKDSGALNQIAAPLHFAREAVDRARSRHPQLAIGLSGRPVIYSDEMASSSRDMTLATIFAILGVSVLFVLAFRSALRPLLAVFALVCAIGCTLGATTLVIGHLNIFAMVFGVVLVGLGIDFGIHLLSHYRNALGHGHTVQNALVEVYGEVGMGTVIGALTTAVALSTTMLTEFAGLAELGLICGMGIILCLLAMLLLFPALLVLVDSRRVGEGNPALLEATRAEPAVRPRIHPAGPLAVTALVLVALVGGAVAALRGWIPFDYNLLSLNDPGSAAVQWEQLLIRHDQRASYAVSVRGSLSEIAELRRQLEPLRASGLVRGFESMAPEDEPAKREVLAQIRRAVPAEFAAPATPSTAPQLRTAVRGLQSAVAELSARGPDFEAAFAPVMGELRHWIELLRDRAGHVELRAAESEPAFVAALAESLARLRSEADPPPVTPSSLPAALRSRLVGAGPDGRVLHALYIYPAKDVWDHDNAGEFNAAVLAIDPQATGVVVQVYEGANLIVRAFGQSVLYAVIAIVLLLFLDLRRPLAVLVALLPLIGGMAVVLGVMTVSALQFNFANFFAVPILVGISVDAGVYLVHSQRHGDPARTVAATRRACVLCGLTTLLGFGMLLLASHRGVASLGLVLTVGCTAGVLVSYYVVPAVLGWFNARGVRL